MKGVIKVELITLTQGTEFLKQTGKRGFLNIHKENFIASDDWWALVYDDIGMAPGSYIFNQKDKLHQKIENWQFISSGKKSGEILKEIRDEIEPTFHPKLYSLADFERRGYFKDIIIIRKADFFGNDFNPGGPLLYHLVILGTKVREAVDFETFNFLHRKLRRKGGRLWMRKDSKQHYPIVFGDNENFGISSGPWAIIMPICEETKDGDYSIVGPGYNEIFS